MRNIKLADGTVYQVDRCGASSDMLYINVIGESIAKLATDFSNPENTVKIEHWFDGTTTDHIWFEGFDQLVALNLTPTGVTVMLRKEG